jgi:hypothetical protein
MKPKALIIIGLCVIPLAACSKTSSEGQPAPSAAVLTDEALDTAQIPVKEDFEEQAKQAINEDNLDEQLAKLEKEIDSDK